MGELARPHTEARAYDLCPGAASGCLSDHATRTGDLPVRAYDIQGDGTIMHSHWLTFERCFHAATEL